MTVHGNPGGKLPLARICSMVIRCSALSKTSSSPVSTLTAVSINRISREASRSKSTCCSSVFFRGVGSYRLVHVNQEKGGKAGLAGVSHRGAKNLGAPSRRICHAATERRSPS